MKKALSLILVLVLCLSFCACGSGNDLTKEEMLASAERFNRAKFNEDCRNNIVTAKEKYTGKVFRLAVLVTEITDDGCYAGGWFIPLDKETIAKLTVGKSVDVVIMIDDIKREETTTTISNKIIANQIYYVGNVSKFKAKVIDVMTNAMYVYLIDEFVELPCRLSVDLTQEQVDEYSQGDIIYVEGTVSKKQESIYFKYISIYGESTIPVYYEMNNAVLTTP